MNVIAEAKDLSIYYEEKAVVRSAAFSLRAGETLAIVGESGSGKSSILRALMGLLPAGTARMTGELFFAGRDMMKCSEEERRAVLGRGMTMIFQNAGASFCPIRTVETQLYEAVCAHEKIARSAFRARAAALMEEIGLVPSVLGAYPFELSGGMAQRVGILAAMLLRPRLLLADEPTSSLDGETEEQVMDMLLRLKEAYSLSIMLVTHNMDVARRMADRILVMRAGRIVEEGTREQIFSAAQQAYTKKLIAAIPANWEG